MAKAERLPTRITGITTSLGAFEQLRARGGVQVMTMYNVFERPPSDLQALKYTDELGMIGSSGTATERCTGPGGNRTYQGQGLFVSGNRPYGLKSLGGKRFDLSDQPLRGMACAVRDYVRNYHGTSRAKAFQRSTPPQAGSLSACG